MRANSVMAIPSPDNSKLPDHVVAFEVSKHQLVVHTLPANRQCVIDNKPAAVRRVLKNELKHNINAQLGRMLVVCEATGGYEDSVLDVTVELDLEAHRAHGTRVRHFAKAKGLKAKSDPLDAPLIARYGLQTEDLVRYCPPSAEVKALRALQERRDDLKQILQAETNRLEHVDHRLVLKTIKASIKCLSRQLKAVEAEIKRLIKSTPDLAHTDKLLRTVPGIGEVTAAALIAHMPELGTLPRNTAAALAGLAPYDNDSGKKKGRRHIQGGRSTVRRNLFMAAVTAMTHCPHLADYADRIISKGKPWKIAVTAVMRKLIVICNAVLASQQPCRYAKSA